MLSTTFNYRRALMTYLFMPCCFVIADIWATIRVGNPMCCKDTFFF